MKYLPLTLLCLGSMAVVRPAMAEMFVRPSVMYVSFQNSGYSNKTGLSLAAGTTLGAGAEHELGLEIVLMDWALSQDLNAGGPFVFPTTGSGHLVPYLANYRYRFGAKDAQLRYYLGPSLGLANYRGDLTQIRSGVIANATVSQWSAVYGGTVGVTVKLTDMLELDVGYRYLHVASIDPGSGSNRIPMDATQVNLLHVGLGFRF